MASAKKYFSDFDVQVTVDEKGRKKRILIYKGNTFEMEVPEETLLRRKIVVLAFTLVMIGTGIAGNLLNVSGNRAGVPAAAGLMAFVPMFFVLYSAIYSLILRTTTLQRAQYRETSLFMKVGAGAVVIFALIAMVGHIVVAFIGEIPEERGGELLSAGLWCVTVILAAVLFLLEMKTKYTERRNDGTIVRKEHFRRGSETY